MQVVCVQSGTAVSSASCERFLPNANRLCSLFLALISSWRVGTGLQESTGITENNKKDIARCCPCACCHPRQCVGRRGRGQLCSSSQTPPGVKALQGQPGLQAELTSPWACGCFLCVSGPFLRSQAAASLPGLFGAILPHFCESRRPPGGGSGAFLRRRQRPGDQGPT